MLNRVGSLKLFALAGFIGALFVGGCGRKPTQPTVVYVTVTPTPTPVPTGTPQRCGFTVAPAVFNPATMKCLNGPYQVRVLMNVTATGTETITITQIRYLDAVCRAPAGGTCGLSTGSFDSFTPKTIEPGRTVSIEALESASCSGRGAALELTLPNLRVDSSCGTVASATSNVLSLVF